MSRPTSPYFSCPVSIVTSPKFTKLLGILGERARGIPLYLFSYAAEHQPDGNFAGYTPDLWVVVFGLHVVPSDSAAQSLAEKWVDGLRKAGWLDESDRLDDEIFGNYNTKLSAEKEANTVQNQFNSAKRWHPDQCEAIALDFFSRFGRWPKGHTVNEGSPPSPDASGLTIPNSSDPGGRAGEPPPPESRRPASGATEAGQSGTTKPTKVLAAPGQRTPQGSPGFKGKGGAGEPPSLSSRMWLINEGLKTAGGEVRKALLKQRADLTAEMVGVVNQPPPPPPPPAPKPKPTAERELMTPLAVAKLFLETPDVLQLHHVKTLRAAKIPLPPEVAARFPLSAAEPRQQPVKGQGSSSTPAKVAPKTTTARPARRAAKSKLVTA